MRTIAEPSDIHLHIDSLVLEGFTGIDATALTHALHESLMKELSALTGTWQNAEVSRARQAITLPAHAGSPQLSMALAKAIRAIVHGARENFCPAMERRDG